MKAYEMMLGDWVQNTNGNIGRVEGIIPHDDGYGPEIVVRYSPSGTAYSDEKVLRPIPLNMELLEKNGFETDGIYAKLCDNLYYDCSTSELYANDGGYETPVLCRIQYVHELQHALRLCGIDKEIEL